MKTITLFALVMIGLGSCTETVYEEVIKYIDRPVPGPTQFVATSTVKECESSDTTLVEMVLKPNTENGQFGKDSLLHVKSTCNLLIKIKGYVLIPKDSVLIPGPTEYLPGDSIPYPVPGPIEYLPGDSIPYPVYDTVWQVRIERQIIYKDTLFMPLYWKSIHFVPEELTPFVTEFYTQARLRGWTNNGGALVIQYSHNMAGEGWNSFSYWIGEEQMVIEVNGALDPKFLYTSVLRELGRLQLKKKYVTSGDLIMNIYFPPEKVTIDSPDKESYLKDLYSNPI